MDTEWNRWFNITNHKLAHGTEAMYQTCYSLKLEFCVPCTLDCYRYSSLFTSENNHILNRGLRQHPGLGSNSTFYAEMINIDNNRCLKSTGTVLHKVCFSVCFLYTTKVKCLLNKATPHLLLPSMVCFDRVQPVMSLGSFCTSWRAGWAESGNAADEARHGDVSASGAVACRSQGACWYEAKVWG